MRNRPQDTVSDIIVRESGATDEHTSEFKGQNGKRCLCVSVCVSVCAWVIDDGRLNRELLQLSCGKLVRTDAITLTADTRPSITVTQSSHGQHLQIAVSVREGVCVFVKEQESKYIHISRTNKSQW